MHATTYPRAGHDDAEGLFVAGLSSLHGTGLAEPGTDVRRLHFHEAVNLAGLLRHTSHNTGLGLASYAGHRPLNGFAPDLRRALDLEHAMLERADDLLRLLGRRPYPDRHAYRPPVANGDPDCLLVLCRAVVAATQLTHYLAAQAADPGLGGRLRELGAEQLRDLSANLDRYRAVVADLWPRQQDESRAQLAGQARELVTMSWRCFYHPDVYADAGFADPWRVAEQAWRHPAQAARRAGLTDALIGFFDGLEPAATAEPGGCGEPGGSRQGRFSRCPALRPEGGAGAA